MLVQMTTTPYMISIVTLPVKSSLCSRSAIITVCYIHGVTSDSLQHNSNESSPDSAVFVHVCLNTCRVLQLYIHKAVYVGLRVR